MQANHTISMTSTEQNTRLVASGIIFLLLMAFMPAAMADTMPWDAFTAKLACQLTGPWIKWMAVIAIALGGLMYGLGELNGPFKQVLQIAGGFSVALGAVAVVNMMFPGTLLSSSGTC